MCIIFLNFLHKICIFLVIFSNIKQHKFSLKFTKLFWIPWYVYSFLLGKKVKKMKKKELKRLEKKLKKELKEKSKKSRKRRRHSSSASSSSESSTDSERKSSSRRRKKSSKKSKKHKKWFSNRFLHCLYLIDWILLLFIFTLFIALLNDERF